MKSFSNQYGHMNKLVFVSWFAMLYCCFAYTSGYCLHVPLLLACFKAFSFSTARLFIGAINYLTSGNFFPDSADLRLVCTKVLNFKLCKGNWWGVQLINLLNNFFLFGIKLVLNFNNVVFPVSCFWHWLENVFLKLD